MKLNYQKLLAVFSFFALAFSVEAFGQTGSIHGRVTYRIQKKVQDVVVYIEHMEGEFRPRQELPIMNQVGMEFVPFVLPVVLGQEVSFKNSASMTHNIFTPDAFPAALKYPGVNLDSKKIVSFMFDQLGSTTLLCNLHPEMEAYILTLQNPYFTLASNEDEARGNFELANVPVGEYVLKTWHNKFKPTSIKVTVSADQATEVELELKR